MDSQTVHLADVCFRFQGAHDESVEVLCSRFVLHEASPVLREALGIEFIEGAKRNADGLMILAMANARLTCGAVRDALVFIHQGKLPETWERKVESLEPMDWLQALGGWANSASLVNAMVGELHQSLKNVAGTSAAEAADVCARTLASLPRGAINMMGPDSARKLLAVCAGGSPLLYERISLDAVAGVAAVMISNDMDCWPALAEVMKVVPTQACMEWLEGTGIDPIQAATLALVRLPPVVVARVMAARADGGLTDDIYQFVITRCMDRMTGPDFAALACFTPLAAKYHMDHVRMALASQTTVAESTGDPVCYSFKFKSSCIASQATHKYKRVTVSAVVDTIYIATTKRRAEFGDGCGCGYHAFMMTSYSGATMTTTFVPRNGCATETMPRGVGAAHCHVNNVFQAGDVYVLLVPSNYIHIKAAQAPKYDLGKVVTQPSPAFAFPGAT